MNQDIRTIFLELGTLRDKNLLSLVMGSCWLIIANENCPTIFKQERERYQDMIIDTHDFHRVMGVLDIAYENSRNREIQV